MKLQDASEFSSFRDQAWCRNLRDRFNVRHVEQFAALLASPDGETALRRLGVPIEDVREPTELLLQGSYGVSLDDPLKPGKLQEDTFTVLPSNGRMSYGLDANRDVFRHLGFGSLLPGVEKKVNSERSARNGYFHPLVPSADYPEDRDRLPAEAFVVDMPPQLPAVRDQQARGTCVGFDLLPKYWSSGNDSWRLGSRLPKEGKSWPSNGRRRKFKR